MPLSSLQQPSCQPAWSVPPSPKNKEENRKLREFLDPNAKASLPKVAKALSLDAQGAM